jgi:hypothetical protein
MIVVVISTVLSAAAMCAIRASKVRRRRGDESMETFAARRRAEY